MFKKLLRKLESGSTSPKKSGEQTKDLTEERVYNIPIFPHLFRTNHQEILLPEMQDQLQVQEAQEDCPNATSSIDRLGNVELS